MRVRHTTSRAPTTTGPRIAARRTPFAAAPTRRLTGRVPPLIGSLTAAAHTHFAAAPTRRSTWHASTSTVSLIAATPTFSAAAPTRHSTARAPTSSGSLTTATLWRTSPSPSSSCATRSAAPPTTTGPRIAARRTHFAAAPTRRLTGRVSHSGLTVLLICTHGSFAGPIKSWRRPTTHI